MEKLNIDALKERANEIATEELMSQISGGTEYACHDSVETPEVIFVPVSTETGGGAGGDQ